MPPSKVTIAIPTLNRAAYLCTAVNSALAQTYSNFEVLVSNNACTDATASLLASISDPRLRVIVQPNTIAMMENFNACLNGATGKYFLLLSDDDILEPTAIEEMVKAYEDGERRGDSIGFVYCGSIVINEDGDPLWYSSTAPSSEIATDLILAFLDGKRCLWPCVILFRKDDMAPGYDVSFALGADAAQWMRAVAAYGSARFVNRRLARYRMHQNATVKTPVDTWLREHEKLGEFAIAQLREGGELSEEISRKVRRGVKRQNARAAYSLINHNLRDRLGESIAAYWANRNIFCGVYGLMMLARGVMPLFLPDFVRVWARSCFRLMSMRS